MHFKAVIYDMDGTLIDSEVHWVEAERNFLSKYDILLTAEHIQMVNGRSLHDGVTILKEKYDLTPSIEQLLSEKHAASQQIYVHQAQPVPGANELIRSVKSAGVRAAIASGSELSRIEMIVNRFGWSPYLDFLISTDHVNFIGKPDPAIYNYTLQQLGLLPTDCVVLEDSVNGVRAAKQAGIPCIAIINERSLGDFSEADHQIASLVDKQLYSILGL